MPVSSYQKRLEERDAAIRRAQDCERGHPHPRRPVYAVKNAPPAPRVAARKTAPEVREYAIKTAPAVPRVARPSEVREYAIKTAPAVPRVARSPEVREYAIKTAPAVPRVARSPEVREYAIKTAPAVPRVVAVPPVVRPIIKSELVAPPRAPHFTPVPPSLQQSYPKVLAWNDPRPGNRVMPPPQPRTLSQIRPTVPVPVVAPSVVPPPVAVSTAPTINASGRRVIRPVLIAPRAPVGPQAPVIPVIQPLPENAVAPRFSSTDKPAAPPGGWKNPSREYMKQHEAEVMSRVTAARQRDRMDWAIASIMARENGWIEGSQKEKSKKKTKKKQS